MELILKKDVDNLGFADDIVKVKSGYGRNFLIPQGLAVLATPSTKKVLAETLKQRAYKEQKVVDVAKEEAEKLSGLEIKISSKTGNDNKLNCASNESNYAGHIFDYKDASGEIGATVSVVIPWFADQYEKGGDWQDLAWWIHDHLDHCGLYFFPSLAAFNITWHQTNKEKTIHSYIDPKGCLKKHPAAGVFKENSMAALQYEQQFGMTPLSAPKVPSVTSGGDPADDFLKG